MRARPHTLRARATPCDTGLAGWRCAPHGASCSKHRHWTPLARADAALDAPAARTVPWPATGLGTMAEPCPHQPSHFDTIQEDQKPTHAGYHSKLEAVGEQGAGPSQSPTWATGTDPTIGLIALIGPLRPRARIIVENASPLVNWQLVVNPCAWDCSLRAGQLPACSNSRSGFLGSARSVAGCR